jgi:isopentenyl diphosphate isomerase/L-lactate dehydrogenase-like FMN-dependent dehydrogenase
MEPINLSDFEALARERLSPLAWEYYEGGAEDEYTVADNVAAYRRIKLRPRMLMDIAERDLTTSVLGLPISLPVVLAPTSHQSMAHPDAEKATLRAAMAAGTIATLGTGNHYAVEEVVAEAPGHPFWFQMYCYENRDVTERIIRRAEAAGARALVVTVDATFAPRRERHIRTNFRLPPEVELRNMIGIGLQDHLLRAENGGMDAFLASLRPMLLTWDEIDWMRRTTDTPIVLKGIMTAEDALLAAEHGVNAIVVSNHGGRQVDGTLATIEALPEIAEAAGDKLEILMDGGIRRGTDVLKALALGARAVLIGRPYLWGLAADGEAGVRQVIELLRAEIWSAMAQCGQADVKQINRSLVSVGSRQ